MGKVKKFTALSIRKITGGKDPLRLVEEFLIRQGHNPDQCLKDKTPETIRWVVTVSEGEELEILVEGIKTIQETTIYMGINVAMVPVRGADELLAAALEIADGLVGIKLSLVGHFLVLSASLGAAAIGVDELEYHFKLIAAQKTWFQTTLAAELDWEVEGEEPA